MNSSILKLYWCMNCNTPLIDNTCRICEAQGEHVNISTISDPRPILPIDINRIKQVVHREFGGGSFKSLFSYGYESTLIGKATYYDEAYQLISDGDIIGFIFYDLYTFKWKFKPSYLGCIRLYENGFIKSVIVDGKISKGSAIGFTNNSEYVALIDRSGSLKGLGEWLIIKWLYQRSLRTK